MTKSRWLVVILLACGIVAWLITRSSGTSYVNYPPKASGPWIAFGDSLTEGVGASPGNDYPTLLGQRLGVKIQNAGRRGETTADGLNRMNSITSAHPRVVLLCLGGNDGLQRLSQSQMYANLGNIIDRLHEGGTFVVLIGIRSAGLLDGNKKGFQKLAKEKHVFYVPDMLRDVLFKPDCMSDALHPNDEGYKRIAERVAEELEPILPALKTD